MLTWDLGDTPPYGSWDIPRVCFVDSALAPWEGGGGGWMLKGNNQQQHQQKGGNTMGGGIRSKSNKPNNHREGGLSLDALVHLGRGIVPEGEKGNILSTISNDRLMLAAMSAAVE